MESLASAAALSVSHVRKKLQTLPTTLDGTYDAALKRIIAQDEDQKDIAFRTLAWVTYAFRPLSLLELQHALAIDPDEDTLDEDLIIDGPNIAAICAGLIIVDPVTEKVHLVHYTTKMYFERVRDKHFPDFHGMITMSCATYLTMPALRNASLWTIVQRFPLAYYAAQYLGDHARLHPEDALDPPVLHLLYQLLSDENRRRPLISLLDGLDLIRSGFYSSQSKSLGTEDVLNDSTASTLVDVASLAGRVESTGIFEDEAINVSKDSVLEVTALHLAASMGLARVASMLLKETPNIDAVDQTGKTALDVAMERGFEKAVEFLVSNGAAVNLHETKGRAALLLAAERDWRSVTERLAVKALAAQSEHDANISLLTAVCRGFLEDTKHLIQEIFSRRTTDTDILGTALFVAVESNQEDIVKALLNGGVDVNSTDNIGQTSMHRATRRGNVALVDILLKHGADINIKNDDGFSPWAANMRPENFKILKHLVDAGADPNTKAQLGISVLYSAAAAGQADTVKFMLRCGTDPSIKTDFDWAPIHWAAYHGFEDCVRILVEAGADVNAVSSQNKAPLDLAIEGNQASIIELLRSHGAKTYEDLTKDPTHDLSRDVNSLRLPDVKPKDFAYLIFDVLYNQSTLLGQYVYAVEHPLGNDFAPYHLSHALDDRQPMEVRRASGRMPTSDDTIFTIVPLSQDFQEMEIQPSGAYASQSPISLRRGWNGSWKVHQEVGGTTVPLFRTRPDWAQPNPSGSCWITDDGEVLARTRGRLECVFLSEKQMENQLFNNLVVCWIARVWYETLYAA